MNVRVVLQLSSPSMKYGGETCESSFVFGGDDVFEGLGTLLEHEVVKLLGMGLAKWARLLWKGKSDHEVGAR